MPQDRAILCVKDDGPGWSSRNAAHDDRAPGLTILQDLAEKLRGTLTFNAESGTEVTAAFPTTAASRTS
jgi:two-component sensor histidine kinase